MDVCVKKLQKSLKILTFPQDFGFTTSRRLNVVESLQFTEGTIVYRTQSVYGQVETWKYAKGKNKMTQGRKRNGVCYVRLTYGGKLLGMNFLK